MKGRRTSSTIVAATTLAVILAGCGGDNEEPEVLLNESADEQTSPPDDAAQDTADGATEDQDAAGTTDPAGGDRPVETNEPGATEVETQTPGDDGGGGEAGLPTVPVEYADALVVAWGSGDQQTMAQLGTEEVVHILGDGGGPNWAQTGVEGAAGSTLVTYENSQSGDVLTLRVDNAAASEGAEQAVVEARYETP